MAHNEVVFPLTVSKWSAAPRWNTTITVGKSGNESRNAEWQDFLWSFNAGFNVRTYADIDTLLGFFNAVKGRETSFLVKNWAGFEVTAWTEFDETVTGASQTFQLFYPFSDGAGNTYHKPITKLQSFADNSSAVAIIYDRGGGGETTPTAVASAPTAGTQFSWSATTGLVTYDPPASGTSTVEFKINGTFYVPCRFDIDELPINQLNYWVASGANKSNVEVPDIPMVEVRV